MDDPPNQKILFGHLEQVFPVPQAGTANIYLRVVCILATHFAARVDAEVQ